MLQTLSLFHLPPNSTLFLDRDGVINRRLPGDYVKRWEEFIFLDGVLEAVAILGKHFDRIVIITNQQGIGKGKMTEADLAGIHRCMLEEIRRAGGRIDAVYHCPDLTTKTPNCRKPDPAMGYRAKNEFPEIEFSHSVMVGDSLSDMAFGAGLGMVNVLIETKEEALEKLAEGEMEVRIDHRFGSLLEMARQIERGG